MVLTTFESRRNYTAEEILWLRHLGHDSPHCSHVTQFVGTLPAGSNLGEGLGMALPPLVDGNLPLGRWPATVDEIENTYVLGLSDKRQQIWRDWLELTTALRDALTTVPAAWLSGSFFTDKSEPGDIDSVYLIEWSILWAARTDAPRAQFLEVVAASQVKDLFGLNVDSYILEWVPSSGPETASWARQYLENRGYWDDLWSRSRSSDARLDAIPRRGYLEVILDGYC